MGPKRNCSRFAVHCEHLDNVEPCATSRLNRGSYERPRVARPAVVGMDEERLENSNAVVPSLDKNKSDDLAVDLKTEVYKRPFLTLGKPRALVLTGVLQRSGLGSCVQAFCDLFSASHDDQ